MWLAWPVSWNKLQSLTEVATLRGSMIEAIVIARSLEGEQLGHYFLASHLLTLRIAFVCYTSRFSRNFLLITMNVIFLRSKSGRAFFDKQLKTRKIWRERLYSREITWYRLRSRCLHYQSNFKFHFTRCTLQLH